MSGPQLEGIFGLPSTPTAVTTVTSAPGALSTAARRVPLAGTLAAAETAFEVLQIHGRVYPVSGTSTVAIQLHTPRGWRTVANTLVGAAGYYEAWLPKPGSYRALYLRAAGPSVAIH